MVQASKENVFRFGDKSLKFMFNLHERFLLVKLNVFANQSNKSLNQTGMLFFKVFCISFFLLQKLDQVGRNQSSTVGSLEANRSKNRYKNVLPCKY